eukprot:11218149-Lingulodinium_polyedra.AAC.1
MPQNGLKVFPHDFMRPHVLLLEFIVMRITPIGVHGSVDALKLGTACARTAIDKHITRSMNDLAYPASC